MFEATSDPERLRALLQEYNEHPERRPKITGEIDERFGKELAILVLDSSGFSRGVHAKGIIHLLALLERLGRMVIPIIEEHGGHVLSRVADNIYAVFSDARAAAEAAVAICEATDIANGPLPASEEFYVSIGIGYGRVLAVEPDEVYGNEMNLACKLGEDLAQRSEILFTEGAYAAVGESPWHFDEQSFTISGINLTAYRLVR